MYLKKTFFHDNSKFLIRIQKMNENLREQVQRRREHLRYEEATAQKGKYFANIQDPERNLDENIDDEDSMCCKYFYYLLIVVIVSYFVGAPIIMLYVGIVSLNCDDMFAPWLIIGAVLHICTELSLVFSLLEKPKLSFKVDVCGILFFTLLFITFIWNVFGFGRIFSGSMNEDPIMEDDTCRWYLYKIPFWLTLMPFILLIPICFVLMYHELHAD